MRSPQPKRATADFSSPQFSNRLSTAVVLWLMLAGCATYMESGSHCSIDEQILATNTTYAWHQESALDLIDESGYISPTIVRQLKKRVEAEMASKGYLLIDPASSNAPAELELQLYLRARRELQESGAYAGHVGPCVYPDCWQAPNDASVQINLQTVGFLAADVYKAGEPVWRGWVERLLYPTERDQATSVIEEAVPLLFAKFPSTH